MAFTVRSLTLDGFDTLPAHARKCVFWELEPALNADGGAVDDPSFEKEVWLSTVLLQWGSCAQVAMFDDGRPAGSAFYAPPGMVPRASHFPTSPVSADAILLTNLTLDPGAEEARLGAELVRTVVSDLVRRNVRALEAFGFREGSDGSGTPDEAETDRRVVEDAVSVPGGCSLRECMIPVLLLEDVGFEIVAPHHRFPRLRLELSRDHDWKQEVEAALDRLLEASSITIADLTPVAAVP